MEMLKNKFTIGLIILVLGVALIGGLQEKKTVQQVDVENGQTINELYK